MRYGSVCSGIEAATAAWHPLGWEPSFFSEIEAFPRAVLSHHYPEVPLHGDFTTIGSDDYDPIDLIVGGTPCQSFSIAGLRKGLDDDRGNLALEFLKLAQRTRPTWVVWENVPGVLSSNGGRDFGAFLGGLGECGYGFAYRVLDAQYFGVAQRRRRVFVVGYLGDWRPPAAVLFERESMSGHPAPSREAEKGTSVGVEIGPSGGRETELNPTLDARCKDVPIRNQLAGAVMHQQKWPADIAQTLDAKHAKHAKHHGQDNQHINGGASLFVLSSGQANAELSPALNCNRDGSPIAFTQYGDEIAGTLTASHDSSPCADRGQNAIAFGWQNSASQGDSVSDSVTPTLDKSKTPAIAFTQNQRDELRELDVPGALSAQPGVKQQTYLANNMAVRRLTPIECERLQGFPDNFTRIPYRNKPADNCPDGPRYKALGNSMAVPCMRWIGERVQKVQDILTENKAIEIVSGMNG